MERKQLIDMVRTAAIGLVMGLHLLYWCGFDPSKNWGAALLFKNGRYGVPLFFVVSGYLISGVITHGASRGYVVRFKEFYVRRAARILPLFFLVVLFGWVQCEFFHATKFLARPIFHSFDHFQYGFWFWFSLVFFFFNWTVCRIGDSYGLQWIIFWSLAVEEQFYLFYPWMLRFFSAQSGIWLAAVVVLGVVYRAFLAFFLHLGMYSPAEVGTFGSMDQIALGAILYFTLKRRPDDFKGKGKCAVLCGLGLGLMAVTYRTLDTGGTLMDCGVVFGPTLISLGCFLFLLGGLNLDLFEGKFFSWMAFPGKLSYGCYLWHPAVLFFMARWLVTLPFDAALPAFWAATVGLASLSYYGFERPANRWVRRWGGLPRGG